MNLSQLINTSKPVPPRENQRFWACPPTECKLYPAHFKQRNEDGVIILSGFQHPFLAYLEAQGAVLCLIDGHITLVAYESLALLYVYQDWLCVECFATPVDLRRKGSASKLLQGLCEASDASGVVIRTRAHEVRGVTSIAPSHPVYAAGVEKKDRMPVRNMPAWFKKFGFQLVAEVYYHGRANGWNFIYRPK